VTVVEHQLTHYDEDFVRDDFVEINLNNSWLEWESLSRATVGPPARAPRGHRVHNGQRVFARRGQQPQRTWHDFSCKSNVVNGVGVATRFAEVALKVDQDERGVSAVCTGSASSAASRSTVIVTFFE
jgi:hypothetical protein